ncbi:hypothetical protein T261_8258 [Streptomyces lydicus]|nr:hypothetical protein T261_8258 [Streptomyces lydicus]
MFLQLNHGAFAPTTDFVDRHRQRAISYPLEFRVTSRTLVSIRIRDIFRTLREWRPEECATVN